MRHREAFDLRTPLALWNFGMAGKMFDVETYILRLFLLKTYFSLRNRSLVLLYSSFELISHVRKYLCEEIFTIGVNFQKLKAEGRHIS